MVGKGLVLFAALTALAACSDSTYGSGGGGCTPTATKVCTVGGNSFSPVNLTVASGTIVSWTNGDGVSHTITSDPASSDTFDIALSSGTQTHAFNTPGDFPYHCKFHGSAGAGMHGTIHVN